MKLFDMFQGYKTYIICIAAGVYGIGIKAGWWPHDPAIDLILGAGGAAAIRSGINSSNGDPPPPPAPATQ